MSDYTAAWLHENEARRNFHCGGYSFGDAGTLAAHTFFGIGSETGREVNELEIDIELFGQMRAEGLHADRL